MSKFRAQSSMEMLFAIGFMLLLFAMFYITIAQQNLFGFNDDLGNRAENIAKTVKAEIDLAAISGDGYQRNITLPGKISEIYDYNITLIPGFVIVNYTIGGKNYNKEATLLTSAVSGNLTKGNVTLTNTNGTVYVSSG